MCQQCIDCKFPLISILILTDVFNLGCKCTIIWKTALSSKTLLVALPYLYSSGSELAVEGIISDFYIQTAKVQEGVVWNSQIAGNWAAVFGVLSQEIHGGSDAVGSE
jgi:hypothetical protein